MLTAMYKFIRMREGSSTVEMALLLPVMLTLIFGVMETGYLLFTQQTVNKAAQLGARTAATGLGHDDGTRIQKIRDTIDQFTDSLSKKGSLTTTIKSSSSKHPGTLVSGAGGPCDIVEVHVQFTYVPLTPFVGPLLGPQITTAGVERMINEPWKVCD